MEVVCAFPQRAQHLGNIVQLALAERIGAEALVIQEPRGALGRLPARIGYARQRLAAVLLVPDALDKAESAAVMAPGQSAP